MSGPRDRDPDKVPANHLGEIHLLKDRLATVQRDLDAARASMRRADQRARIVEQPATMTGPGHCPRCGHRLAILRLT